MYNGTEHSHLSSTENNVVLTSPGFQRFAVFFNSCDKRKTLLKEDTFAHWGSSLQNTLLSILPTTDDPSSKYHYIDNDIGCTFQAAAAGISPRAASTSAGSRSVSTGSCSLAGSAAKSGSSPAQHSSPVAPDSRQRAPAGPLSTQRSPAASRTEGGEGCREPLTAESFDSGEWPTSGGQPEGPWTAEVRNCRCKGPWGHWAVQIASVCRERGRQDGVA